MTIIACWIADDTVRCLADARLTFLGSQSGLGADVGSKLAAVPIVVWSLNEKGNFAQSLTHSLGFAYAGSSLIGSTTFLRASSITQMLRADGDPQLPSVADIANLFAGVATANTRDVKTTLPKAEPSTCLIFGFCPVEQRPRVFRLAPDIIDGSFETVVEESSPSAIQPLVLGSGTALFEKVGTELFNAGVPRATPEVFARTLRDPRARNHLIGGVTASLTAGPEGAAVDVVLHWDGTEGSKITEYVLGLAIREAGRIGGLGAGFRASEPDYYYRLGESLLLKDRVEETDLATRESLRDLAVIHYMTELAKKAPDLHSVRAHHAPFYVHAYKPAPSECCYCVKCTKCPAEVPLFRDVSAGEVRYPLLGATLITRCWNCGAPVRVLSEHVFPQKWPKTVGLAIFKS